MLKENKIVFLVLSILCLSLASSVSGAVRSSTNYKIQEDSINVGGLDLSSSTSYELRDIIGEVASGIASSTTYQSAGGYRQMDENYLSLSVPSSVSLGSLGGATGGVAIGNGTWSVKTDSEAGYSLSIKASTEPALKSSDSSIADYTPSLAGTPDYNWSIGSAGSEFGFSPYNAFSQADLFKNNGSSCNTGSDISDGKCWYGLSTSNVEIVNKNIRTFVSGENTKINFKIEINNSQRAGSYAATVTVTVVNN